MAAATTNNAPGKGFSLQGLLVGLFAGLAAYGVIEYWIDGADDSPLALGALFFIVTAAAAYLLLAEAGNHLKAGGAGLAIAAILFLPDFYIASAAAQYPASLTEFPIFFWFACRSFVAYVMAALAKAMLESGAPPRYAPVFFHGLTMPLIAGGAAIFSGLAMILLFAWARLLKELDVGYFNKLFQEPWFILPFLGAIGGLSIALMRGQQSVLGALRFVLLLIARILMVITAVFTVTLLLVFALKGVDVVFARPYPAALMMALALAGMLIFNGVYQNGEGAPPPLWLRIPTLAALTGFPVYACIAFYAFALRIGAYGLTPPRIAGITVNALVAAYSLVCLAGLLSELRWRSKRWMAPVAPLNTAMAFAWVVALILLATPLANPWAISAKSQYALLASGKIAAADFDFGYLQFKLGEYGERALDDLLALDDHPEAETIRARVKTARAAPTYWHYQNSETAPTEALKPDHAPPASDGPDSLPLNPKDAEDENPDSQP